MRGHDLKIGKTLFETGNILRPRPWRTGILFTSAMGSIMFGRMVPKLKMVLLSMISKRKLLAEITAWGLSATQKVTTASIWHLFM